MVCVVKSQKAVSRFNCLIRWIDLVPNNKTDYLPYMSHKFIAVD